MMNVLDVILTEIETVLGQVDEGQVRDVMQAFSKDQRVFANGEDVPAFPRGALQCT